MEAHIIIERAYLSSFCVWAIVAVSATGQTSVANQPGSGACA